MEALHVVGGGAVSYEQGTMYIVPYLHVHVQGYLAHKKMPTPLGPP